MAELPDLGKHCGLGACKQLDFLPFTCPHCSRTFCKDHITADLHDCDKVPEPTKPDFSASTRTYACHVPECGAAELTPVSCPDCERPCCLSHRHPSEHDCAAWRAEREQAERRRPEFERAAAEQAARLARPLAVPGAADGSARSERARRTARQVQLMRLKQRAAGAGAVPLGERLYLLALPPGGRGVARPVFVSRRWTLGRTVDALAELVGARNENDRSGGRRLLLYRRADGGRVGDAMDAPIDQLPPGQLNNAETVVLEYGDPAQAQREDVTQYSVT